MTSLDFLIPYAYGEEVLIEKKSRFIACVWHVETEAEARRLIEEARKNNREAAHNVYAYILRENNVMRYSDDGEPQGTAGMPVLEVLRREGVTDVLCVVTRYFGGVLLGAGGLVRAYNSAAKLGLDAAGIAKMEPFFIVSITLPYTLHGQLEKLLPSHGCQILDTQFSDRVEITCSILVGGEEGLNQALAEHSAGTVSAVIKEQRFMGRLLSPKEGDS